MINLGIVLALAGAGFYAYAANQSAMESASVLAVAKAADEKVGAINSQIENVYSKYESEMKKIQEYAELYKMRGAYAEVLQQLSRKAASIKFWFNEFAPLINYDVDAAELGEKGELKGTRLIDMRGGRAKSDSSARNAAPEEVNTRKAGKDPMVTAIYISGFTIKPVKGDGLPQRGMMHDLVAANFDERSADSLFSYENKKVESSTMHYFQFVNPKNDKGLPDYVERFSMIMPLKTPIAIPELSAGKK